MNDVAKKKTQYPKRRGQIIRNSIIAAGVLAVIGGAIGGYAWYQNDQKSWVMDFEGERIGKEELRYFAEGVAMSGTSTSEDITADGYASMLSYHVLEKAAKEAGITRSAEDLATAESQIADYKAYITGQGALEPKMSDELWARLLSSSSIGNQLYDYYTKDYQVDEAAFNEAFSDYYANQKAQWVDEELKYILVYDEETANEALAFINGGGAFDEAIAQYMTFGEGETPQTINVNQLGLEAEQTDQVLALAEGEHTGIITLGDEESTAYAIFEAQTKNVPSEEEVRATYLETYTNSAKEGVFSAKMEEYSASVNATKHDKGYDAFDVRSY